MTANKSLAVSNNIMKRAAFALLLVIASAACEQPGPLPAVPGTGREEKIDLKKYWFPTDSARPFPLNDAVQSGDVNEVGRLLDQGVNPNLRWGESGDHFALQQGVDLIARGHPVSVSVEIVRLLLKHGADPNWRWCLPGTREPSEWRPLCTAEKGMTPLVFAAFAGHRDIVGLLIEAGADPHARDFTGRSALDYAADEVVFELIARALFPDVATRDRDSLDWLKRTGWPSYDPKRSKTPLLRALHHDDNGFFVFHFGDASEDRMLGRVRILMRIGADPNERLTERSPLSWALTHRYFRVARVLLENGADVNQRWCERFPAPWIAPGYAPKHLIVNPGEPSADSACNAANGITPLMWTAGAGDPDGVALLLEFKADRTLTDWAGRSALHYAVWRNVWDLLKAP